MPVSNPAETSPKQLGAFYEDLEKLLLDEMRKQPKLLDVRLKLAELYFQTRRVDDFILHARDTRDSIKNLDKSDEWHRIVSMGRMLRPSESLFSDFNGDAIEFVATQLASDLPAYSRIGDDERFKKPLQALADAYEEIRKDPRFLAQLDIEMMQTAGHPSSLQPAQRLTDFLGGAKIYFKRDDQGGRFAHITGAIVGQALLAQRMGKKTLVAFSGNGRSGVLVASIAARLGLNATVFMNADQIHLQKSNVFRMWLCGANVQEIDPKDRSGTDVRKAAFDHWARHSADTFLIMGLDAAPHPYPMMTLEFTSVVGRECRRQMYATNKKAPDLLVTRGGDNADAIGFFPPFLKAPNTRLVCVEPADHFDPAQNAAAQPKNPNVFNPILQPLTQQEQQRAAQILEGMEYPRVVREHSWLKATGRVEYMQIGSVAARKAISDLSRYEGIVPAIETSYAIAWACQEAVKMQKDQSIVILLSENVDKNIWEIGKALGVPL